MTDAYRFVVVFVLLVIVEPAAQLVKSGHDWRKLNDLVELIRDVDRVLRTRPDNENDIGEIDGTHAICLVRRAQDSIFVGNAFNCPTVKPLVSEGASTENGSPQLRIFQ